MGVQALVNGVCVLKRYEQGHRTMLVKSDVDSMFDYLFPVGDDQQSEPDLEADWQKWPGCKGSQGKYDRMHNCVAGQCRWPWVQSRGPAQIAWPENLLDLAVILWSQANLNLPRPAAEYE